MAHNLQERYSKLTDIKLRATLVTKDNVIFNTRFDGNPVAGAVKVPVRDGEVVVADYNKATGKALSTGSTVYLNIPVNQDKAVNELIDGHDAAGVPDNLVADRIDSAGYSLGLTLDTAGLTTLVAAETAINDSTDPRNGKKAEVITYDGTTGNVLGSDNIFDAFTDAGEKMDNAYVPNDGRRYAIVSPYAYKLLIKDKDNFIKKGDLSQQVVMTGAVGMVNGFIIYKSNNIPDGANITASSKNYKGKVGVIFGHPDFATRIDEYRVPIHVQDLNGSGTYIGACAVQGRMVYAHCVSKPQAFVLLKYAGAEITG